MKVAKAENNVIKFAWISIVRKATEKVLFAYKLTQNKVHQSTLRHCIQYEKTVFQWRPYRGEGILATVVKSMMKKGVVIV